MFLRMILVASFCSALLPSGFGQTQNTDSQTLRDILAELRAMHEDMRVTETTQLLVAELEMQQGVVNRATENTDSARAKLNDVRMELTQLAAEIQHTQDTLDKATDENDRKALPVEIDRLQSNVALMKAAERDANNTLQDMQQRLQNAQDKLAEIEAEMSAAISRLSPLPKATRQP